MMTQEWCGDQPARQGVGVLGVAQVAGAVECVQARDGEVGRVADVVQPCGGFQEIGVGAENGRQAACPSGDALDVGPAAGKGLLQECLGEMSGPGSQRVHVAQARQPRRDVHGRGMASEDVLFTAGSRHPAMVLASARRPRRRQESAGFRSYHRGLKGDDRGDLDAEIDGRAASGISQARGVV